ncbi:hypothetical protein BE20_24820 [Sorangium cellulosum]|nr:hypothetical protein BE20_24820 [Sorangium cellulosum]
MARRRSGQRGHEGCEHLSLEEIGDAPMARLVPDDRLARLALCFVREDDGTARHLSRAKMRRRASSQATGWERPARMSSRRLRASSTHARSTSSEDSSPRFPGAAGQGRAVRSLGKLHRLVEEFFGREAVRDEGGGSDEAT